jgi:hypothetical protein
MTKPEKVTMSEKRDLVGLMAELSRRIGEKHPWGTVGVFNHVSQVCQQVLQRSWPHDEGGKGN